MIFSYVLSRRISMSLNARRVASSLTIAGGGVLAAISLAAPATADVWSIDPTVYGFDIVSQSGMPPFDQTVLEDGSFRVVHVFPDGSTGGYSPSGLLEVTHSFGMTNDDLVVASSSAGSYLPDHSVIDILNLGNGFENIYADLPGDGTGGANLITDTLVTPFGNFDIPTTFDAAAFGSAPAAAVGDALAADASDPLPSWSIVDGLSAPTVLSESLQVPFYQSLLEQGSFGVVQTSPDITKFTYVDGTLNYTSLFGMSHEELTFTGAITDPVHPSVLDIMNFGGGFQNDYVDITNAGSPNTITDTLVTPFGNFEIPMSFDAAAVPAAATDWLEPGAFTAALEADWASLVALF
jgi:hypothetical protein